ncbi:ParB/RepB/Spo0J family partition protein [Anaerofilum sp. BX8]|uniref:ParB/RepB/Spo0J family partition protein n=1 Tax=Anaerofilum hominis TaxID=2763016 RepID=A0A923L1V4_9FIRM|nr:ParB/RepB/Spo0J family partition protein [Anaerofilum hominis]MBC5582313.1 ParB/RepB/Spo0J family partition protein [Anaerofilum hominis]
MFLSRLQVTGQVVLVPLEQIEPSPWQARRRFDPREMQALAASIRENGMLQPVTLQQLGKNRYALVAGERRVRAARMLGMEKVPAILTDYEDGQAAVLSLEENLQRQQLGPFEEAEALRQLLTLWNCTQTDGAKRLGLSQSALANKLRLLAVAPEVRRAAEEAELTERHVRALLRLETCAQQLEAVEKIRAEKLTVSETERLVERIGKEKRSKPKRRGMVRDVRIFVNTVNRAVDMMKSSGIPASMERSETGDYIQYVVRIPTNKATLH